MRGNIANILEATGLPANALKLELTESVLIDATPGTLSQFASVRDLGVELGIDDFGTGYSSLTYLRRLPVSFLKVDRAFVTGLADEPHDRAIVNAVVNLAQALGLRTIAEGVETQAQFAALADMGCDLAQGYLLGRPVPATTTLPRALPEFALAGRRAECPQRHPGPVRVLLVDDDRRLREVVRLTLHLDGGFETVAEAADGTEAIDLARLHQPDLVLLDLRMPGVGGLEALPRILTAAPAARIVVLTGLDRTELDIPAMAGIAGCFEKAADLTEVVAGLRELVGSLS